MKHARAEPSQHVPQQLQRVVERGWGHIQPLERMIEQAQHRASGELLFFGIALSLWSVSAVARTLTEGFNIAYQVTETRRWWKGLLFSLVFGPVLALAVIGATVLMLVGPQVVERIASLVGLADTFVSLWGWLRFPLALSLLAVVLSVVYRYGPNAAQRFRTVVLGAVLVVVLWAIISIGFSIYLPIYLANFANYGLTYGSLGTAVGLLLYLYISASIVLVGAEVNASIYKSATDRAEQSGKPVSEDEAMKTYRTG